MVKKVLNLMTNVTPKVTHPSPLPPSTLIAVIVMGQVRPDLTSYGFIIKCFAEAKKPRSALMTFHQMRRRGLQANSFIYMSVLKALWTLRDGFSASQIIKEMQELGGK